MIEVLRLGHRPDRDKRITTHVALVARAFGADRISVTTSDRKLEETILSVNERWGGDFSIETGTGWKRELKNWEGYKVHLSMYGEQLEKAMPSIPKDKDLLIIVGAEKVPREVYDNVDINIAVGNQPHSEVSALSLFLYLYNDGKMKEFDDGKMRITPNPRGKTVEVVEDDP